MNAPIHAQAPLVPNLHTILTNIPPLSKFTVIDLSNIFFSVLVHPDSQYWFAFQFEGKGYMFTRMPQGYAESPTVYNQALASSLSSLTLSPGTVRRQPAGLCPDEGTVYV